MPNENDTAQFGTDAYGAKQLKNERKERSELEDLSKEQGHYNPQNSPKTSADTPSIDSYNYGAFSQEPKQGPKQDPEMIAQGEEWHTTQAGRYKNTPETATQRFNGGKPPVVQGTIEGNVYQPGTAEKKNEQHQAQTDQRRAAEQNSGKKTQGTGLDTYDADRPLSEVPENVRGSVIRQRQVAREAERMKAAGTNAPVERRPGIADAQAAAQRISEQAQKDVTYVYNENGQLENKEAYEARTQAQKDATDTESDAQPTQSEGQQPEPKKEGGQPEPKKEGGQPEAEGERPWDTTGKLTGVGRALGDLAGASVGALGAAAEGVAGAANAGFKGAGKLISEPLNAGAALDALGEGLKSLGDGAVGVADAYKDVRSPRDIRDRDRALMAEKYINSKFDEIKAKYVGEKDMKDLTDKDLAYIHEDMNRLLLPEWNKIKDIPEERRTREQKAYANAYETMERALGKRAEAINQEKYRDLSNARSRLYDLQGQKREKEAELKEAERSSGMTADETERKRQEASPGLGRSRAEKLRSKPPFATQEEYAQFTNAVKNGDIETVSRMIGNDPDRISWANEYAQLRDTMNASGADQVQPLSETDQMMSNVLHHVMRRGESEPQIKELDGKRYMWIQHRDGTGDWTEVDADNKIIDASSMKNVKDPEGWARRHPHMMSRQSQEPVGQPQVETVDETAEADTAGEAQAQTGQSQETIKGPSWIPADEYGNVKPTNDPNRFEHYGANGKIDGYYVNKNGKGVFYDIATTTPEKKTAQGASKTEEAQQEEAVAGEQVDEVGEQSGEEQGQSAEQVQDNEPLTWGDPDFVKKLRARLNYDEAGIAKRYTDIAQNPEGRMKIADTYNKRLDELRKLEKNLSVYGDESFKGEDLWKYLEGGDGELASYADKDMWVDVLGQVYNNNKEFQDEYGFTEDGHLAKKINGPPSDQDEQVSEGELEQPAEQVQTDGVVNEEQTQPEEQESAEETVAQPNVYVDRTGQQFEIPEGATVTSEPGKPLTYDLDGRHYAEILHGSRKDNSMKPSDFVEVDENGLVIDQDYIKDHLDWAKKYLGQRVNPDVFDVVVNENGLDISNVGEPEIPAGADTKNNPFPFYNKTKFAYNLNGVPYAWMDVPNGAGGVTRIAAKANQKGFITDRGVIESINKNDPDWLWENRAKGELKVGRNGKLYLNMSGLFDLFTMEYLSTNKNIATGYPWTEAKNKYDEISALIHTFEKRDWKSKDEYMEAMDAIKGKVNEMNNIQAKPAKKYWNSHDPTWYDVKFGKDPDRQFYEMGNIMVPWSPGFKEYGNTNKDTMPVRILQDVFAKYDANKNDPEMAKLANKVMFDMLAWQLRGKADKNDLAKRFEEWAKDPDMLSKVDAEAIKAITNGASFKNYVNSLVGQAQKEGENLEEMSAADEFDRIAGEMGAENPVVEPEEQVQEDTTGENGAGQAEILEKEPDLTPDDPDYWSIKSPTLPKDFSNTNQGNLTVKIRDYDVIFKPVDDGKPGEFAVTAQYASGKSAHKYVPNFGKTITGKDWDDLRKQADSALDKHINGAGNGGANPAPKSKFEENYDRLGSKNPLIQEAEIKTNPLTRNPWLQDLKNTKGDINKLEETFKKIMTQNTKWYSNPNNQRLMDVLRMLHKELWS